MASADKLLKTGLWHHQKGDLKQAVALYRQAVELDPNRAELLQVLAKALIAQNKLDEAIDFLDRAIQLQPQQATLYQDLGTALLRKGQEEQAEAAFHQALCLRPDLPLACHNLGVIAMSRGDEAEAAQHYARALLLRPDLAETHLNLGNALAQVGHFARAEDHFYEAMRLRPDLPDIHLSLGHAFRDQVLYEEAVASYRRALELRPDSERAHRQLGRVLGLMGKVDEGRQHYDKALQLRPSNEIRIRLATMIPPIYRSLEELRQTRQQIVENVAGLRRDGVALDPTARTVPEMFFLAYQGYNDRTLLHDLGALYASAIPAERRGGPTVAPERRRIRMGIFSRFLRGHTIGAITRGFFAQLDRQDFQVAALTTQSPPDATAEFIQQYADAYVVVPHVLPAARERILDLDLDVLLYADIGMEPLSYSLAFSRLAPVQCVTWGHALTTGIPTMDYFLSSELLDTAEAQEHYTETLVRLPTLNFYYYRPPPPQPQRDRAYFGLPADATLYVCAQSLFKFHPEFDDLLGNILRADPRGLLVLVEGRTPSWKELLLQRFERTMGDVVDRVCFLPYQPFNDFLSLNTLADVLLDPIHFGAGNSSYQALALGTPIVTLPSPFLRGRMTYALYRRMGVMDAVAQDPADYVARAVRLGTDRDHRAALRSRILAANHVLFEDTEAVRQLERFLKDAVARTRTQ
jgi:predicted O-linked N-acetylglucosamine transferase (SPINDLY family)